MGGLLAQIEMERLQQEVVLFVAQEDQEILRGAEYFPLLNSLRIEKK